MELKMEISKDNLSRLLDHIKDTLIIYNMQPVRANDFDECICCGKTIKVDDNGDDSIENIPHDDNCIIHLVNELEQAIEYNRYPNLNYSDGICDKCGC